MSVYLVVFKKLPILDNSDLQKKVAKVIPRIPSVPSCTQRAFLPAPHLGHASSVSSLRILTLALPTFLVDCHSVCLSVWLLTEVLSPL